MEHKSHVRRGIYSVGRFKVQHVKEFAVIVHPFFEENGHSEFYLKNLYNFISTFSEPMLTFETKDKLDETIGRYKKANLIRNNIFFVGTGDRSPEPEKIGWEGVKDFIREFSPEKLKVAGGYYSKYVDLHEKPHYGGCLGVAIDTLMEDFKNIEVVDCCTFGQ